MASPTQLPFLAILLAWSLPFLSVSDLAIAAAPPNPPRLIVRADDMGYAHAGNLAIIETATNGIATSIEIIAPAPWFPEAVKLLAEHPSIDVGVHLALTSEWDHVKWRPVSACPSLVDRDGFFHPMIWPNPNYPGRALLQQVWKLEDIEREFRAQIELVKRHVPRVSHLSGHMGCTNLTDDVRALTQRLADEYGLAIDLQELGVQNVSYAGPKTTAEEKVTSFLAMLATLEAGKTYLFVDHPGFDTPELRAIHHVGYEDVATDRQGVVDCWTDARVKAAIRERGIELVSYRDLKP